MQRIFSFETRLEVVRLYEEEKLSPGMIAKKIGTVHSVVERWLKLYKYNGIEGLKIKEYHQVYDEELKSKVINQVIVQNNPYTRVAAMNNLSPSTVKRWGGRIYKRAKNERKEKHDNVGRGGCNSRKIQACERS